MGMIYKKMPKIEKILMKMVCAVLAVIPMALLLLFSTGSFILAFIAGLCGIGASMSVLAIVVMVISGTFALKYLLMASGCALFLILLTLALTIGQEAVPMLLRGMTAKLIKVVKEPM